MENRIIICPGCGNEFSFPITIKPHDLIGMGMDIEKAKHLFETRDAILEKMNIMTNEEKKQLEMQYNNIERLIVNSSNGNSQEAYNYYGISDDSILCLECRRKSKSQGIRKR